MNSERQASESGRRPRHADLVSELLILPDGRVLVHNLTPTFAALLSALNPNCEQITARLNPSALSTDELSN